MSSALNVKCIERWFLNQSTSWPVCFARKAVVYHQADGRRQKKSICQRSSKVIVGGGSLLLDVFFKECWKFSNFFLVNDTGAQPFFKKKIKKKSKETSPQYKIYLVDNASNLRLTKQFLFSAANICSHLIWMLKSYSETACNSRLSCQLLQFHACNRQHDPLCFLVWGKKNK